MVVTDAINRHRFTVKTVLQAKNFLRGTAKKKPAFLEKYKGTLKKNNLHLDGKLVVPKEKVDSYLRNRIYRGKTPLTRDAAFYAISKNAVGVSRSAIQTFLKKQRVIRETDNQQATSKRGSRSVHKKGQLHYDLIEIKMKDLPRVIKVKGTLDVEKDKAGKVVKDNEGKEIRKGYIFSMVDALTS